MTIRVVLVERCALTDGSTRLEVDDEIDGRSCPSSPTNDEQIGVDVTESAVTRTTAVTVIRHTRGMGASRLRPVVNKLRRRRQKQSTKTIMSQ